MNKRTESIKVLLRPFVYLFRTVCRLSLATIYPSQITDAKQIPIIINNRNRLEFLLDLIQALETRGYHNIFIIDNDSSFPPLLDFYENCKYHVFRLKENVGHLAMWDTDIYKQFIRDYYVYTDADVVPVESCPADCIEYFWKTLKSNPSVQKVGFSLKIDDLPDSFDKKDEVIEWEKQYYEKKVGEEFYVGFIDTTFALYRPFMRAGLGARMFRTAFPYQAKHMPWYVDSKNLSAEEKYYISHSSTSTHWTKLNKVT